MLLVAAFTVCLSGCGDYLGEYRLEDVRLTNELPADALDGKFVPDGRQFFRVELSSDTSLYAAETGPGLYTDADFCPLSNPHRLIAFGPVASDEKAVEDYRRERELKPSGDGRYHYFVYLVPRSAPRKLISNSDDIIPAYNLTDANRDICVRFFVPGYNIIKSRSSTVKVPADRLSAAAAKA
ncbi:MAG: hypothetical protein AVDCRST_MAG31-1975 [uncultured Sphingomonas sp.]|uniref:Uncharacterized protein n=1 Tax=uncultured Sphingomonas sp. TaxID=158754 RepID=A0A6J4TLH4_9SPHN|nr:hypothetical protein [uncultured Sphingomonas sp.]CAA9526459.1 MAG: hypothetical protein AVDCRST_MAG31-1975 [uncultured Sphingomonas sp.]